MALKETFCHPEGIVLTFPSLSLSGSARKSRPNTRGMRSLHPQKDFCFAAADATPAWCHPTDDTGGSGSPP